MEEAKNTTRKELYALKARTMRELVNSVNQEGIKKADIVTVLREDGLYTLLYYK